MIIVNNIKYFDIGEVINYLNENNIYNISFSSLNERIKRDIKKDKDKSTPDSLINHIISQQNEEIKTMFYLDFDYLEQSISLYNNCIETQVAAKNIFAEWKSLKNNINTSIKSIAATLSSYFDARKIDLINGCKTYIRLCDYEEVINQIKILKDKKCITKQDFLKEINNIYPGLEFKEFPYNYFNEVSEKLNLEVITLEDRFCFMEKKYKFYPNETVAASLEYFKEKFKDKIKLINITFDEYTALTQEDFKNNFEEIDLDNLLSNKLNIKYKKNFKSVEDTFIETDIKVIWIGIRNTYVSKVELERYLDFISNYTKVTPYLQQYGILFNSSTAKNMGLNLVYYKKHYYMTKEDLEKYRDKSLFNKKFRDSPSIFQRLNFKIEQCPHKKEDKFPNAKKYFLAFVENFSKNQNTMGSVSISYRLYNILLDNIHTDLQPCNQVENNKLFNKLLFLSQNSNGLHFMIIAFNKFLREYKHFNLSEIESTKTFTEKTPYTPTQFINLLSSLIQVMEDEEKLKKLYRNWHLSSSFLYVFLHYTLAWRRNDILTKLPFIDLRLINPDIDDDESFIQWLERGNRPSLKYCREVCIAIEEESERLREDAEKNKEKLNCIISNSLMEHIGLLICLNQANRNIYIKKLGKRKIKETCLSPSYIMPFKIHEQFSNYLDIDIYKILGSKFDNIRMNKGFLSLVQQKAEELDLFAYYYCQILRAHKFNLEHLSEVTKIYLDKHISKKSVAAFASGTMGSVAYSLMQLVDDEFSKKSIEEKVTQLNELSLTPYAIEKNTKRIFNKISTIKKELEHYFSNGGCRENFVQDVVYGSSFYGIEKRTKCLLKITRKDNRIIRIAPISLINKNCNNRCPLNKRSCIGCDYMIALRYFIYEFEQRFNLMLNQLENAKSDLDKDINIEIINNSYIPVLNDLEILLGEEINNVIDVNRCSKLIEMYQR